MKKTLLLLFTSLCFAFPVCAQDIDKMPTIIVTGVAEIEVAPDEVNISLEVTKIDKDLQTAKRLNDESVAKILELTRLFAVTPQNVKTNSISVSMNYVSVRDPKNKIYDNDGDEIGKRVFKGYMVSKTVVVKLTDISRFEKFFEEVLKTGLTEVGDVTFESSKFRETRVQARDMAMKLAREKAIAMAAAVNQTIGKAIHIREGIATDSGGFTNGVGISANGNRGRSNNFTLSGGASSISTTIAPGAISVEASVTIVFQLN